jgi:hypothetical protein
MTLASSLERILGDKFYPMLEDGVEAAEASIRLLCHDLQDHDGDGRAFMENLAEARRVRRRVDTELIHTIMASLAREDIRALSAALLEIPEAAWALARTRLAAGDRLPSMDYAPLIQALSTAGDTLGALVRQLPQWMDIEYVKSLNDQLRLAEEEVNHTECLWLQAARAADASQSLQGIILFDLADALEELFECLRRAADIVVMIVMKNA